MSPQVENHQRWKNMRVRKQWLCKLFQSWCKICNKFYTVLSRKWVMLRFPTFWGDTYGFNFSKFLTSTLKKRGKNNLWHNCCHGQTVHLWISLCWRHSVDVTLLIFNVNVLFFYVSLCKVISWFHFIDITLKISLCSCHFVYFFFMSLCWCQSVDVALLTIRYVYEQKLKSNFNGMTDASIDMTKTTWTFLYELPTWSHKTFCW